MTSFRQAYGTCPFMRTDWIRPIAAVAHPPSGGGILPSTRHLGARRCTPQTSTHWVSVERENAVPARAKCLPVDRATGAVRGNPVRKHQKASQPVESALWPAPRSRKTHRLRTEPSTPRRSVIRTVRAGPSACHRPAHRSQLMIGTMEPGRDRHIGATP